MELKVGLEYIYTYKPINQRVRIAWENIGPGAVNINEALVCVETETGNPFVFPAALAARYLTTEPPVRGRKGIPTNKL